MGPSIIFDKSTLQSLSIDEACWLETFYLSVITPLFFVETLGDLEKQVAQGRTAEQVVGNLAEKTPPSAFPTVHHRTLCLAELLGAFRVKMDGRPIVPAGQPVNSQNQRGVYFDSPPEREALTRWQDGEFIKLDRELAKAWRANLSEIDLNYIYTKYRCRLKSLDEVNRATDAILNKDGLRYASIRNAMNSVRVGGSEWKQILGRWKNLGGVPLSVFAPYTCHVMKVDLFFNLAIGADLISRDRPTNKVDMAYLYYLPFCMIFASNDNLHRRTVQYFLRSNQLFLDGIELKADLKRLDEHFSEFPEDQKQRGILSFASTPPHDGFLITRLWDRFMRSDWRERDDVPRGAMEDEKLVEHVRKIVAAAKNAPMNVDPSASEEDDFMVIQKAVPIRMGKWRMLPPEVEAANGDSAGGSQ